MCIYKFTSLHIAHDGLEYVIHTPWRSSTITRFTKDDHTPLSTPTIPFICRTGPAKPGEHQQQEVHGLEVTAKRRADELEVGPLLSLVSDLEIKWLHRLMWRNYSILERLTYSLNMYIWYVYIYNMYVLYTRIMFILCVCLYVYYIFYLWNSVLYIHISWCKNSAHQRFTFEWTVPFQGLDVS